MIGRAGCENGDPQSVSSIAQWELFMNPWRREQYILIHVYYMWHSYCVQVIIRVWPASYISSEVWATTSSTSTSRRVWSSSCPGSPSGSIGTLLRHGPRSASLPSSPWPRSYQAPTPHSQRSPTWKASTSTWSRASSWSSRPSWNTLRSVTSAGRSCRPAWGEAECGTTV